MSEPARPLSGEFHVPVAEGLILSIVTCGLYNIYWNYTQFRAMNALLGREEYRFVNWLVLSLVTCGLYHIYTEYKMGSDLQEYLVKNGFTGNPNLSTIGLVVSCFGLTVIADAIYQHELNRLCA